MPIYSRLRRVEEKKAQKRLLIALGGSFALLVFLGLFGLKLLVGFSLLVDRIRGGSPAPSAQQNLILPPVLDPLPEATNSATLQISGKGTPKLQAIIYVNDKEYKKLPVADDGTFTQSDIAVDEGSVTVSAKLADEKGALSDLSNVITTLIDRKPPTLEITKPDDNTTVNDGTHRVTVEGTSEEDARITINGRIVVTRSDGTFAYRMPITDGANKLNVVASDAAGNQTTVERNVIYQP